MDAGSHDVGGNALAGVDLAAAAQLDHCLAHRLTAFGHGLQLEVIQLIVAAGDGFDCLESGIDRAIANVNAFHSLTVLGQLDVGGGGDGVAGGDHIGVQLVGGGNLHCVGSHDGIQLLGTDLLLLGSDALESVIDLYAVIFGKVIAKLLSDLGNSSNIIVSCQIYTGISLTVHDDQAAIAKAVETLGYDLSEEDMTKVYQAFCRIAAKKEQVSSKELDAIIASAALQVPPTYKLDSFVITSGNTISSTAHIKLMKNDIPMEGVSIGDGPIDAAFVAIERITGCHYELDDFQLQAVTEGREAMGQTVVKLRSGGKVYSGKGISTDIVAAGIHAYLSALNKIVYEEEEA